MDVEEQNELAGEIADAQTLIDANDVDRAQEILDGVRERLEHH